MQSESRYLQCRYVVDGVYLSTYAILNESKSRLVVEGVYLSTYMMRVGIDLQDLMVRPCFEPEGAEYAGYELRHLQDLASTAAYLRPRIGLSIH